MANLGIGNVQICYKNDRLIENFHQAETELLFSWLEEILNVVNTGTEPIERKLN